MNNFISKKNIAKLVIQIGITFLVISSLLGFIIYRLAFSHFSDTLTDYTITLEQSMANSGVTVIENELTREQGQVKALATSFTIPNQNDSRCVLPSLYPQENIYRIVYVSKDKTFSSDGRQRGIEKREDVVKAFQGETNVYGPYFNEEKEYVICYTTPVMRDDKIVGVLSVEKDGYYLSELIQSIQFVNSGESYVIDSKGTDIAVSNKEHIEWVNEQYNAREILKKQKDSQTQSIADLEQHGLNGESGIGTYYWDKGLCYLAYAPVPSTGWVVLTGIREEELIHLTQTALYESFIQGPMLPISVALFLIFTGLVIYWSVSSMKKNNELNEKLKLIAHHDALTGVKNRASFNETIFKFSKDIPKQLACIYIDANGLHEINNHLGHQAGDEMLTTIASQLQYEFKKDNIFRIGGDEFVILCQDYQLVDIEKKMEKICQKLSSQGYDISVGIQWQNEDININEMIHEAEKEMQEDKKMFYQGSGRERQSRMLNHQLEQTLLEKQYADAFLAVMAPEFKGVYFVNLNTDNLIHLFIPPYFAEILEEENDVFSRSLCVYTERFVMDKYQKAFEKFYNYEELEKMLDKDIIPELIYQKRDGTWLHLKVLKFKTYTKENKETLWIFSNVDA